MTKKILLLETSGRVGRVAVASPHAILQERRLDEARRHARDLAPAVQTLLQEQGWRPKNVDAIFVSLGPGSYTGLRVGIMSAKAFAYATGWRASLASRRSMRSLSRRPAPGIRRCQYVDVVSDQAKTTSTGNGSRATTMACRRPSFHCASLRAGMVDRTQPLSLRHWPRFAPPSRQNRRRHSPAAVFSLGCATRQHPPAWHAPVGSG